LLREVLVGKTEQRRPSGLVRPVGEGLRPARDARGRPAGGAAGPAMASQSHARPWARPAKAAGVPAAAAGNAGGGGVLRRLR